MDEKKNVVRTIPKIVEPKTSSSSFSMPKIPPKKNPSPIVAPSIKNVPPRKQPENIKPKTVETEIQEDIATEVANDIPTESVEQVEESVNEVVEELTEAVVEDDAEELTEEVIEDDAEETTEAVEESVNEVEDENEALTDIDEQDIQPVQEYKEENNQKELKRKKEKEPKEKKKLSKKQKNSIIVVLFLAIIVFAVIGVVTILPEAVKLETPELKVYNLSNQIILHVDENNKCDYYEFFVQKHGESEKYFKESSNELKLIAYLQSNGLGVYDVWARYYSKNSQLISDKCQKQTFTYTKVLDTPSVAYSQDNKLIWAHVPNSIGYRVYYTQNDYFEVEKTKTNETVVFDINKAFKNKNLTAGCYALYVQAMANQTAYYENSELSDSKTFRYECELQYADNVVYTKSTGVLSFDFDTENVPVTQYKLDITFNGTRKETFVVSDVLQCLQHSFNLSLAIQNYGYDIDDVTNLMITVIGYNDYVKNSEPETATIM